MKVIIDEAGEIIAKATDDHTLIKATIASRRRQPRQRLFLARYWRACEAITSSSIVKLSSTYRLSRSLWRMSSTQALIFVAAVVIAVALLLLAANA
jgi:hypothetical protein